MRLKNLTDRFGTAVAVLTVTLIMGLVVVTVSGVFYYYSLKRSDSLPDNGKSHKIWWRLELYGRKATGGVPELSWIELWRMSRQKGGFGLENIVQGVSAGGSLMNAYDTGDGRAAGKLIFRQRCVMCHGIDAVGGIGPPLNHPGLKH